MFSSGLSKKNTNRLARKQEKALFSSDKVIIHGELEIAIGFLNLAHFAHGCDYSIHVLNLTMELYCLKSIGIKMNWKKHHGISWRKYDRIIQYQKVNFQSFQFARAEIFCTQKGKCLSLF